MIPAMQGELGRPRRVLMVAPTPFFAHRGCHVRILEEIYALRALGHEVVLCTYGLGDDVPGVHTVRALSVPWYRKLSAGPTWHKLYLDVLLFAAAFRLARRFRPDVLHAHLHEGAFVAAPIARWLGIPLVADLQGSLAGELADHGFFYHWTWGKRAFAWLERWINRMPDQAVVSSGPLAEQVHADRDGRAISLVGDGVDADTFRPDPEARRRLRAELGFAPDDLVIAFLGLLTPYQGVDLLLESAVDVTQAVPEVKLLVMGFPNEEAYRSRAEALGIGGRVRFTGRVPYSESPAFLGAADLAVAPKLSPTEGNQKILTYMAIGLPTVAFDTPVNRSMLSDLGVYARLGDRADLTRNLIQLAGDPALRRRLSSELRRRAADDLSWAAGARQFSAIYDRLIGSPRRAVGEPLSPLTKASR